MEEMSEYFSTVSRQLIYIHRVLQVFICVLILIASLSISIRGTAQCDQGLDFIDFPIDKENDDLVWLSDRLPALVVFFGEEDASHVQHRALSESLLNNSTFIGDAVHSIVYVMDAPPNHWLDSTHFFPFIEGPTRPPNFYWLTAQTISDWTADLDQVLVADSACDASLYLYFDEEASVNCPFLDGEENLSNEEILGCNTLTDILTDTPMTIATSDTATSNVPKAALMYVCSTDSKVRDFALMSWPEDTDDYLQAMVDHPDLDVADSLEAEEMLVDHLQTGVDDFLLALDQPSCGSLPVYPQILGLPQSPIIECGAPLPAPAAVQFSLYGEDDLLSEFSVVIDTLFNSCNQGYRRISISYVPAVPYAIWIPDDVLATYKYYIKVEDEEAPVWSLPEATLVVECDSIRQKIYRSSPPSVQDFCNTDDFVNVNVVAIEDHFDGPTPFFTKTWTATDICGNSSSLSRIFYVEDSQIEITTCPDDVTGLQSLDSIHPIYLGTAIPEIDIYTPVSYSYEDLPVNNGVKRTWMVENGCGAVASCEQLFLMEKADSERLLIFPSPASEEFTILIDTQKSVALSMAIYDMMGREVVRRADLDSDSRLTTYISSLARGRYTVQVTYADGSRSIGALMKE